MDYSKIKKYYYENPNKSLKEIARIFNVNYRTLQSKKNRDNWDKKEISEEDKVENLYTNKGFKNNPKLCTNEEDKILYLLEELLSIESKLTPRVQIFAEEYFLTKDKRKSYQKAGYKQSYNRSSVYRLLKNKKVLKYINLMSEAENQLKSFGSKSTENILLNALNMDITDIVEDKEVVRKVKIKDSLEEVTSREIYLKENLEPQIRKLVTGVKLSKFGVEYIVFSKEKAVAYLLNLMQINSKIEKARQEIQIKKEQLEINKKSLEIKMKLSNIANDEQKEGIQRILKMFGILEESEVNLMDD